MTWSQVLATVEDAAIYTTVAVLVTAAVGWLIARVKVLPLWRQHRAAQAAILANQKLLLGDRFERPTA